MDTYDTLRRNDRQIALWLLVCCALVFIIVVVGGLTRLTGSGLSMVEWNPIFGLLPPLNDAQWQAVFDQYRTSPEYRYINAGMTVDEFKSIYWLEYIHRMIGRGIGLAFLLPLLYFWLRGKIQAGLRPRLVAMFVLGGLQGVLGWYMVKSGLVDKPQVSQYRLTAHLALAIAIYSYMLWVAMDLLSRGEASAGGARQGHTTLLRRIAILVTGFAFVTILSGGFVAGTKAGYAYSTFPLMAGQWIPDGLFSLQPLWKNFFENVLTVQFTHRVLAVGLLFAIALMWLLAWRLEPRGEMRLGFHLALGAVVVQVILGISTLLMYVPIALASAHQAWALVVFTVLLALVHQLRRPVEAGRLEARSAAPTRGAEPSGV
jgi:heme a synthase